MDETTSYLIPTIPPPMGKRCCGCMPMDTEAPGWVAYVDGRTAGCPPQMHHLVR